MTLAELKLLTAERLKDAKALLGRKRYAFAYCVAGYAVECALKACVLKQMVNTGWVFAPAEEGKGKKSLQDVLTHDFVKLVEIAGLSGALVEQLAAGGEGRTRFAEFWKVACEWTVEVRYVPKSKEDAEALFVAITDKTDGVLTWIRNYW